MKKFYSILAVVAMTTVANAQSQSMNAFNGSDFEDWNTFTSVLSSHGIKSYATQGFDKGVASSNSLNIKGTPTGNDYVFTAKAPANVPTTGVKSVSFMVNGVSDKSLSLNIYKTDGKYYPFNVGNLSTTDVTIEATTSNQYNGAINTEGRWVKVTLNLDGKTDYVTEEGKEFFSLKVGKTANYSLDIDDIVINYENNLSVTTFTKEKATLVKNTLVTNNTLTFSNGGDVKIINLNGQVVKTAKVEANAILDISNLATGVYIVNGVVNGEKVSQKIIKK